MTTPEPDLRDALLAAVPSLRAFAISLSGQVDRADDLVQETLVRAIENAHRFEEGTSLQSWTYTILRNLFISDCRKRWREVADPDSAIAEKVAVVPEQDARLDFEDLIDALNKLSPDHREIILLIGAEGMSYEQAAKICGITVGTVKSRINRARTRIAELMHAARPHYGTVRAA